MATIRHVSCFAVLLALSMAPLFGQESAGDEDEALDQIVQVRDGRSKLPIPQARVELWNLSDFPTEGLPTDRPVAVFETSAAGEVHLKNLSDGATLTVVITCPGYGRLIEEITAIADGEVEEFELEQEVVIEGRVLDWKGAPVANAQIITSGDDGSFDPAEDPVVKAKQGIPVEGIFQGVTDSDGKFVLRGVTPYRWYRITATDEAGFTADAYAYHPVPGTRATRTLKITKVASLSVSLELPEGITVGSRGLACVIKGSTWDAVHPVADKDKAPFKHWLFDRLDVGKQVLYVWPHGCAPETVALDLKAGANHAEITLRRGRELTGKVLSSDGKPVQGATVGFDSPDKIIERRVPTGADGGFSMTDLPTADVVITARVPGLFPFSSTLPAEAREIEIRMKALPRIRGRIVMGKDEPLPKSIDVSYLTPSTIRLDEKGCFDVEWKPQSFRNARAFLIRVPDWAPIKVGPFKPEGGAVIDLEDLTKPESRRISGTLDGPGREAMPNTMIYLSNMDVGQLDKAKTDEFGRFEFERVPGMPCIVTARPPAQQANVFAPLVHFLGAKGDETLTLTFHTGGRITGRVSWPSGEGCANVAVHIHPVGPDGRVGTCFGCCASTGSEGEFMSGPVQPGTYRILVYELGDDIVRGPDVTVEEGEIEKVVIIGPDRD